MEHVVKGRQHMHSLCVCMLCLNHRARDELDRSTLDLDSRQKRQIDVSDSHRGEFDSTVQIGMVYSTRHVLHA